MASSDICGAICSISSIAGSFRSMMNPLWPDAQPYDSFILIGVAALVVWLNRSSMFQRDGAITDVLMPSDMSD